LALREKYVFREKVHPWYKEELSDPSTPKPDPEPFQYRPEPASQVLNVIFHSVST
jgi:AMP deaminase